MILLEWHMELLTIRTRTRAVLLSIIAIIAFLLFLRISFELVEANTENGFVDAIFQATDYLIEPTEGAVVLEPGDDLDPFNFDALLAMILYVIGGLIIIEIITGIMHDEAEEIVQNVVDAFFKILEFIVTLKIIFVFFEIGVPKETAPWFVKLIYDLTSWTDIVSAPEIVDANIDWAAIIVLIIIVVFDVLSEQFLTSLFHRGDRPKKTRTKTVVKKEKKSQPVQQNITVNVPAPAPSQQGSSPFGGSQK